MRLLFDQNLSHRLLGAPPKVVWLRFGNTTVDQAHAKIRNSCSKIELLEDDSGDLEVLEIW